MKDELKRFGVILEHKWKIEGNLNNKTRIEGKWCEDDSLYCIDVPAQLAGLIVELQNTLSQKYNEILNMERTLAKKTAGLEVIFKQSKT